MKCKNCEQETKNKKFCSRACAAVVNNKLSPKRKARRIECKGRCGTFLIEYFGRFYCKPCVKANKLNILSITVGDIKKRYKNPEKRKGLNVNASIRYYCGRIHKDTKVRHNFCQKCGYSNHIELCHVRPVSDFVDNDNATMKEINSNENILLLCPNHHWELDNGLLDSKDVPPRNCA